jgi:WS/DGAT/MGAT family acyltransferase
LASTQLDLSRPLWQFHLIENYGDGCALICRLHHCIADRVALVYVLLSMSDSEPDVPWPVIHPEELRWDVPQRRWDSLRPVSGTLHKARQATRTTLHQAWDMLSSPPRAAELIRTGADGAAALGRLVLRWPDPTTVLKGELGVPKRVAWSAPVPLDSVKAVGRDLGGTVNDVLLTAVTGGLRRYLQGRGEPVDGLSFRAVIPVNLRAPGAELELGNRFGLVFLSLPVGIAEPGERLRELRLRMDALKDSKEAPVAYGILNVMGASPPCVQGLAMAIFEKKGTAVMTNVMGPQQKLYLAGAPLEALMFWVPQSGRLGIGVSILSYTGQVWVGVMTDQGLVPDPEKIIAGFHAEFDALLGAVGGTRRSADVRRMSVLLDGALAKLDALLEEARPTPAVTVETASASCQALTKAGKACRNRALPGSLFCQVHRDE